VGQSESQREGGGEGEEEDAQDAKSS
jgi:hypothetical protein